MPVCGVRCAVCVTWMPSLWADQVGQAGDRQAGRRGGGAASAPLTHLRLARDSMDQCRTDDRVRVCVKTLEEGSSRDERVVNRCK